MAQATVRYNPDRSICEVQSGESPDETWVMEIDDDEAGRILVDDETGKQYYLALSDEEGLAPDTVYELVPLETEVEEGVELEVEDEDEDVDEETSNGAH